MKALLAIVFLAVVALAGVMAVALPDDPGPVILCTCSKTKNSCKDLPRQQCLECWQDSCGRSQSGQSGCPLNCTLINCGFDVPCP
jgi:hypothetical protein